MSERLGFTPEEEVEKAEEGLNVTHSLSMAEYAKRSAETDPSIYTDEYYLVAGKTRRDHGLVPHTQTLMARGRSAGR